MSKTAPRNHPNDYLVPDLLALNLKLVFCGTAPSAASAKAKAYYAKTGNSFWPTLYRLGFTPRLLAPQEYASLLPLGMGLTDLCKTASGNDDELPAQAIEVETLKTKIMHFKPQLVAFTSKHGAELFFGRAVEYGLQRERMGLTGFYVLCSTSGRARRFWREDVWKGLADALQAMC